MLRTTAFGLILALALAGQQHKATKPFKPVGPPQLVIDDPLIAKEEGCAKDLAKVPSLDGLERKKFVTELLLFRCVIFEKGMVSVQSLGYKEFGEGKNKVGLRQVKLFAGGNFVTGWVLADEVYDLTWQTGPKSQVKK
jgi:hypothetical protein